MAPPSAPTLGTKSVMGEGGALAWGLGLNLAMLAAAAHLLPLAQQQPGAWGLEGWWRGGGGAGAAGSKGLVVDPFSAAVLLLHVGWAGALFVLRRRPAAGGQRVAAACALSLRLVPKVVALAAAALPDGAHPPLLASALAFLVRADRPGFGLIVLWNMTVLQVGRGRGHGECRGGLAAAPAMWKAVGARGD